MINPEICITIDDGPSLNFRAKVDYLYEQNIPAVFFCIGKKIEKDPGAIVYAAEKGYLIGNHSYSHHRFSSLSVKDIIREIDKTDKLIEDIFQANNIDQQQRLFRFPYGDKGDLKYGLLFKDFNNAFLSGMGFPQWTIKNFGFLIKPIIAKKKIKGIERSAFIQNFLAEKGYTNFPLEIRYHYYKELNKDLDWSWTYDTMDWISQHNNVNLRKIDPLFERLLQDCPEDFRGPLKEKNSFLDSYSKQIVLMHDYDENFQLFKDLIIRFKSLRSIFIDPK